MQQMREAFPWDQAPRYLLRDRDAIYGRDFSSLTRDMEMEEVLTAPRSPWQNPFAERLVGSIRRECLDQALEGLRAIAPLPISVAVFSDATSYKTKRRDFFQRLRKQANEVVKVEARSGDELSFTCEKTAPFLSA
jgi:hypothetical protein